MAPIQRCMQRLLILNRGEIAIRILQSCREIPNPPMAYALYTPSDSTHISLGRPHYALPISSPAGFTDIDSILGIIQKHAIDSVHPGYGFLSESAEFARRCQEIDVMVVGPGWEVLERTGDKIKAKILAEECGVPILKAMKHAVKDFVEVRRFATQVGFPIMIKAVDGGGGRGIRLASTQDELQSAFERGKAESPSGMVFAEQAAIQGFKHIEVQIIGDGQGGVKHLWERDCSVQRRFQKIVEVAPAPVQDRRVVAEVIKSAMKMAESLKYLGLGTFEYLVNVKAEEFFFLEINPRIQVEHTISECVAGIDLVRAQLMIAQGLEGIGNKFADAAQAQINPEKCSIQFRLCAEDPFANFALSIGKVANVVFPTGNGIRVDSHVHYGGVVGSDFDNMMAKIIVTAPSWGQTISKARRALEEVRVQGVKTNINLLRAIAADDTFCSGHADTSWLEKSMSQLLEASRRMSVETEKATDAYPELPSSKSEVGATSNTNISMKKGDAWSLKLEGENVPAGASHLKIEKITRNEFPEALSAEISFTTPGQQSVSFKATMESTNASAAGTSSTHRRGDVNNSSHIVLPMSGKLVEVLVQEGDKVKENEVVAFIKQMKMELEVRSPRAGVIGWAIELEDDEGDDVAEGTLLAELRQEANPKLPKMQSKL